MRFSERHGYRPVKAAIQVDFMDDDLRTAIWNALQFAFWNTAKPSTGIYRVFSLADPQNRLLATLCRTLWLDYFKRPVDELSSEWPKVLSELRDHFFACPWYEVYDFIEFVAQHWPDARGAQAFRDYCNGMLEREVSGYRFVGGVVTPIIAQAETTSVEEALQGAGEAVEAHLSRALALLSDRQQPDYRNSIKESISAVEAAVRERTGSSKGTLGDLLTLLEKQSGLHPALKASMSKLYGYTSDAGGIRHALLEGDHSTFSEAKFMLVVCSAFVTFIAASDARADGA